MSGSGCSSVDSAGLSFDSSRAQSVLDFIEVDPLFAAGGFAERDDADFMICFRMGNRNGNATEQAEGDEPLFAKKDTVVFEGKGQAL